MERKFYTFLLFPGAHGKLYKIQLPTYIVHVLLAFSLFGIVTFTAMINSYARMLVKVSDYNRLRDQREALKTQNQSLESQVNQTNTKLNSLESLANDVALTYGFGETRRPRFPAALMTLATQSNATVESSYKASVYAFKMMKEMALRPAGSALGRSLLGAPAFDRATIPSLWPVRGQITGGFGERMDPFSGEGAFHAGVDISAPAGADVAAAADGLVLAAGPENGYGKEILIDHGDGLSTKYGHLSKMFVVVGQEVKRGQIIGCVGMTGRATGPHLHYEVRVHDAPVNPAKFLHG